MSDLVGNRNGFLIRRLSYSKSTVFLSKMRAATMVEVLAVEIRRACLGRRNVTELSIVQKLKLMKPAAIHRHAQTGGSLVTRIQGLRI